MPVPDVEKIIHTDPIEDYYEVGSELGRGKFAIVKRCKEKRTGNQFAAKVLRKRRRGKSCRDEILVEIDVMRQAMDHDRIIKLHEVFETENEFYIIIELATGGELFRVIAVDPLPEDKAREVVWQLLQGVNHLHSLNIVHMDLKPENILLYRKGSLDIKIADFGLAVQLQAGRELRNLVGTAEYVAPEVLNFEPLSIYSDMWSIGALTYALLTGYSPFQGDTHQETFLNVSTCDYNFDDEVFGNVSQEAREFIEELLVIPPKQRLPAAKCLLHPWIAKLRPSALSTSLSSLDSPLALDSSSDPSQNSSNSSSFAPAPGPTVEPATTSSSFSRPEDMTKVSKKMAAVCIEMHGEEEERKKDSLPGCGLAPATPTIEKTLTLVVDTKVAGPPPHHPHHTRKLSYQGSMSIDVDPCPSPSSPVPSVAEGSEGKGDGAGRSRPSSRAAMATTTTDYDPKTLEKLEKYKRLKDARTRADIPGSEARVSSTGPVRASECVLSPDLKKSVDAAKDKEQVPQGEKTAPQGGKTAPQGEKTALQGEKTAPQGENNIPPECGILGSPKTLSSNDWFTTSSPDKMMRTLGRSGASLHTAFEKPKVSDVKETKVEPVVKETKLEPVVKIEPVVKETKVESVTKESKVEPVVKESRMEPKVESVTKESKVEPVAKESRMEPVAKENKVEPAAKFELVVKEVKQLRNSKSLGASFQKEHTPTTDASKQTDVAKLTAELPEVTKPEVTKPAAKFSEPLKASEATPTRAGERGGFKAAEKTTKCSDPPATSDITMETGRHTTVLVQTVGRTHIAEKGNHTPIKAGSKEGAEGSGQQERPPRRNISASSIKMDVSKDKVEEKRDVPSPPAIILSPPAIIVEVRKTSSAEPCRGTSMEPSRGTCVEPSRGTSVEPSRGTCVEPSRGTSVEPSRGTSVEPSRGTSVEPSRGTSVEPSRGTSVEPSRGTSVEPSRGLSPESCKEASSSPGQSKGASVEPCRGASSEPCRGPSSEPSEGNTSECSQGSVSTTIVVLSPTALECDHGDQPSGVVKRHHKMLSDDHKKQLKTQWRKTPQISEEAQMAILLGEIPDDDHAHTRIMATDSCNPPATAMLETCVEEEDVKVESPDPTSAEVVAMRTGPAIRAYHSAILSTSPERVEEVPKLRPKGNPASCIQTSTGEDDEFNQKTDVFLSPIHRFHSGSMSHSHSTPDLSSLSMDVMNKVKSCTVDRSNSRRCKNRVSITEDGYVTSSHQAMQSKHTTTVTRSKPLFASSKVSGGPTSSSIANRIKSKLGFKN